MRTSRALIYGALTVGALDLADAFIFFGLRGARPERILQSIAAGVLGRAAFQGGAPAAALGVVCHFTVAFCIVGTFFLAARRLPVLVRQPLVSGAVYGPAAWVVMNFVVIPLSAAPHGPQRAAVVANGLLIHVLGVGLPSALFARAAFGPPADDTPRSASSAGVPRP
jgi:hypothetical protein